MNNKGAMTISYLRNGHSPCCYLLWECGSVYRNSQTAGSQAVILDRGEHNKVQVVFAQTQKGLLANYAAASPVLSSLKLVPPCQESLGQGWDPFLRVVLHWCARGIMDAKRES